MCNCVVSKKTITCQQDTSIPTSILPLLGKQHKYKFCINKINSYKKEKKEKKILLIKSPFVVVLNSGQF